MLSDCFCLRCKDQFRNVKVFLICSTSEYCPLVFVDEIKVYQHPPRDHIIMCHELRDHYFPAWDIHAKPVDWLERMVEPQVEEGQFDDCEDDD